MDERLVDRELEQVLATWCVNNQRRDIFGMCAKVVTPDDFTNENCAKAWKVQQQIYDQNREFDLMTFNVQAKDIELLQWMITTDNSKTSPLADVLAYAEHISVLGSKRRYALAIAEVQNNIGNPEVSLEKCTELIRNTLEEVRERNGGIQELKEVMNTVLSDAQRLKNGDIPTQVLTGFSYIDRTGGLKEGDLDIIAGRTSNGKTAFSTAIALNVAMQGTPTAIYSMEMTNEQLGRRIASMCSGIPSRIIEQSPMDDTQFKNFVDAVGRASSAKIVFDRRRTSDIDHILHSIRQMVNDRGVRVVVIDYLQQLTGIGFRDKRSLLSEACVKLKNLAVELKITIIALSQLARAQAGGNNAPLMSQLKECGEIENSADNVWMVYRAELYKENYPKPWDTYDTRNTSLVINSKSRSSSVGEFLCGFNSECTLYYDIDESQVSQVTTTDDLIDKCPY